MVIPFTYEISLDNASLNYISEILQNNAYSPYTYNFRNIF